MNILFMDVDGVLNTDNDIDKGMGYTDDAKVQLLKDIIESYDIYIVISSSWRNNKSDSVALRRKLYKFGILDRVIGKTPDLGADFGKVPRYQEIKQWIDEHIANGKPITKYAIVDDLRLATNEEMRQNFFKTDSLHGLTNKISDSIAAHFKPSESI